MQCDSKTIIESISTSILVIDSQLKVAYANTAAEQLFSMSRTKLQGIKLLDLIDSNEKSLIPFRTRIHHLFKDSLLLISLSPQNTKIASMPTCISHHIPAEHVV